MENFAALIGGAGRNYTEIGEMNYLGNFVKLLFQTDASPYQHVWPEMQFGWRIIIGTIIGFFGAGFGGISGLGGGGIYVPMLTLIIGFDAKSSTAISKCMIMGMAASSVYYNLKLRHPNLDMPIIDYDLALLIQPMLMMGISIGIIFNVIFPDWLVTILLIILFLAISIKAFFKGLETWEKETIIIKEKAEFLKSREEGEYKTLQSEPANSSSNSAESDQVSIIENVSWKEFGLLIFVWIAFLILQVCAKLYTSKCSPWYWVLNSLQIPVSLGVTFYEAKGLYTGKRTITSLGNQEQSFEIHQLVTYCFLGVMAGLIGGLLGIGGGSIVGSLFLELGVPPQVTTATATFAMLFSSSMSVVEYYLLNRFPVPYAVYFVGITIIAAWLGQHAARKLIAYLGRASIVIFTLALIVIVSAICLGGVGISNMIEKIANHEYMGFEDLCYEA